MFKKQKIMHWRQCCHSIAHELSHYFQWIKRHEEWDGEGTYDDQCGMMRQAVYYAREIVRDYADVVDHP